MPKWDSRYTKSYGIRLVADQVKPICTIVCEIPLVRLCNPDCRLAFHIMLGWKYETSFSDLIKEMVASDRLAAELALALLLAMVS